MPVPELGGVTVVLTRAPADNAPLHYALRARGAHVIELSLVAVRPLASATALRNALRSLTSRDRLVLTSRIGAEAVGRALEGRALRAPVAVIGEASRSAARLVGLDPDFMASEPNGRTLARELPLPRGRVLLARSDRALPDLPELLRLRGARVQDVVAYHSVSPTPPQIGAVRQALAEDAPLVCLSSPSAVDRFVELVGMESARRALLLAIGDTTASRIHSVIGSGAVVVSGFALDDTIARIAALVRGLSS